MNTLVEIGLSIAIMPVLFMILWSMRDIPKEIIAIVRKGDTEDRLRVMYFVVGVTGIIIATIGSVLSI